MLIFIPLAAADQQPAEEQPILEHLNQAIAWYRRLTAQAQVTTEAAPAALGSPARSTSWNAPCPRFARRPRPVLPRPHPAYRPAGRQRE